MLRMEPYLWMETYSVQHWAPCFQLVMNWVHCWAQCFDWENCWEKKMVSGLQKEMCWAS